MPGIWALSYQRESIWRLARSRAWRPQPTSGISASHVHICSLNQIFSFLLRIDPGTAHDNVNVFDQLCIKYQSYYQSNQSIL